MMNLEKTGSSLTLRFGRWGNEKFIFVMASCCMLFFAWGPIMLWVVKPKPENFLCERSTGKCTRRYIFIGGNQILEWPIDDMKGSRVLTDPKNGEVAWVIDRKSTGMFWVEISKPDPNVKAEYEKQAAAFQAFLDAPSQPRFEVSQMVAHVNFSVGPMLFAIVIVAWVFFGILNGWRTRVTIDRAKGEVRVSRRPRLFPFGRSHFPLAEVAGARAGTGGIFLFAWIATVRFEIFGKGGRALFKRRMMLGRKSGEAVRADIDAVNEFVVSSKSAA